MENLVELFVYMPQRPSILYRKVYDLLGNSEHSFGSAEIIFDSVRHRSNDHQHPIVKINQDFVFSIGSARFNPALQFILVHIRDLAALRRKARGAINLVYCPQSPKIARQKLQGNYEQVGP